MSATRDTPELSINLGHLQVESLKAISLFAGAIGYSWLTLVIWPVTGANAPPAAWIGGALLTLGAIGGYLLRDRCLSSASASLIGGIVIAVACALLAFRQPSLAYLFVLPILFASVLLSQAAMFGVAGGVHVLTLVINVAILRRPLASVDVLLPFGTITLVMLASWLSARNLYTALAWVWRGYEIARQNEQIARERQGELRRALKALDEATYRLERANYMLTIARDQAEEARRLKQQFAQTISHELRTPLNLIVGFTELMAQSPEYYGSPLPPAYVRDLSIVHRNACHLQTLVNDVLDLARIEAAQMSLVPEETDPASLVREAVATARSLVEARGLALRMEIEPDLPRLRVDPTRIRQVLFNLLNNAARFTERGSVTVSVRRQEEEVIFAVTDTGIGIAPEDIPRIFEEFRQLDGSTRRRQGGAGLGLAISKRFVEMHGGRIWVESRVGQGSTFYFSLPVSREDSPVSMGHLLRGAGAIPSECKGDRILLAVTRSPSAGTLLTRYVRGYRTVVVHDLEQAQRAARQLMPQTVVIDTACAALEPAQLEGLARAWGLPRTPFIACPLPGEEPLRERLAVDGYLVKPISRQSLWDMLRQFGEDVDRVLVIDDDRDFVRLVGRLLDSPIRRYQVISAYSGREGLEMMRVRRPDLVLLDLILPDMDGAQVVERIRSAPEWQHIPIVVISAQDEVNDVEALTGTVMLTKAGGFTPGEIVQWVQGVMEMAAKPRTHNIGSTLR
ncbi:MAG: ATP-binding protein [Anaerolineae bacterium]|nr:ATP-binding protein [Anaerolineae bacterium]MDW8099797.1 ATP-binding protein [Anaerolineae bacterium]